MSHYLNKKVLITGGMGFIGSHLARSLVALGAEVTLVDSMIPEYGGNPANIADIKNLIKINYCDIRDSFAMSYLINDKDVLFNLAGQTSHMDSMSAPLTDLAINATAQLSILEACRNVNTNIKIVYASTRQMYGRPEYLPVDEQHPIRPVDVNGINKFAGESYHLLYNNVYGIRTCSLRLTNTYGPGMRIKDARQTFLGIWLKLLIEGTPIKIFGDGLQLRDFNFISDCIEALLLAGSSETSNGKVYNLGSKEVINLKNLAELIIQLNKSGSYEVIAYPEDRKAIDIGDYYSDYKKIESELNWTPSVELKDGLLETLLFYKENYRKYC